ncbi:MAG: hypothetical protein K8T20_11500 [Planctomycetes bacterium]|nr:hypothetical protein [Planctomycetota bacterium]
MTNTETPPDVGKDARKAVAEWLLEVSALLAVFPWLDQLVFHPKGAFDWPLTAMSLCSSGGLFFSGLGLLVHSKRRQYALVGLGTLMLSTGFLLFLGR